MYAALNSITSTRVDCLGRREYGTMRWGDRILCGGWRRPSSDLQKDGDEVGFGRGRDHTLPPNKPTRGAKDGISHGFRVSPHRKHCVPNIATQRRDRGAVQTPTSATFYHLISMGHDATGHPILGKIPRCQTVG